MTSTVLSKKRKTNVPGQLAGYTIPQPDQRNVADTVGPTPEGAIDATPVLEADRRQAETGSAQPGVVVPSTEVEDYGGIESTVTGQPTPPPPTILTGEPGAGGGGTTYGDATGRPGEGGATTGELDPYQSIGSVFEDYARGALGPQDTSEEEALIRELMQQQQGIDIYNQRAAAGRSGFASSGAEFGIEGDLRRRAAQAASQDILDVRRQAKQDSFKNAVAAAGISLDEARFASDAAYRQAVLDAYNAILGGQPPPAEDGGGGIDSPEDVINMLPEEWRDEARWIGDVNADGKIDLQDLISVRGAGAVSGAGRNPAEAVTATNVGDVRVPTGDEKANASTVSSEGQVPQPSKDAGSDGGGHYYWGADGKLYKVRLGTVGG